MRIEEILTERAISPAIKQMSDEDRRDWIMFLIRWLRGEFMQKATDEQLAKWEEFAQLFPHGVTAPLPLMRLLTIPIKYADMKEFELKQPAPGPVGSWTSTKRGLDSVAGIARDFAEGELEQKTARIGISAVIEPNDLLATVKTIRQAFLAFTHDWHGQFEYTQTKRGNKYDTISTHYHPYLGDTSEDFHEELGYYQGLCRRYTGGPYRQYEHIVRTHPVQAKRVIIYRVGSKELRYGNDDPHN